MNMLGDEFKCFAMRNIKLPWGKRKFDERAKALFDDCLCLEFDCPGALECPFYRTRKKLEESKRRAFERINSLPEYMQLGISIKYYGGMMPWKEGESEG